jgi:phosphoribosylamine--glycine ligase
MHLDRLEPPFVVKADGLAAGKGVLVSDDREEAMVWVDYCFEGAFGAAGSQVLIEEYLEGPELSLFVVCTERGAVPLEPARDYKRLLDGDRGPNTGGMGSYSPVDLDPGLIPGVMDDIVEPILRQMEEDGARFLGFLYAGLVLTGEGPKVLEFNVRLGDPETQAILPRLDSDLIELLEGGRPSWSDMCAVNVVLAAEGYPTEPKKGARLSGLGSVPSGVIVFHAGTKREGGDVVVDGGRVLGVVGTGKTLEEARGRAYDAVEVIRWPGAVLRADIAADSQV